MKKRANISPVPQLFLWYLVILFCFSYDAPMLAQVVEVLPEAHITGVAADGQQIWFSTYGAGIRVYSTKTDKWTVYSTKEKNVESDFFYCIAVSKEYVWAGASDGLYILNRKNNRWTKRKFAAGGEYGNWIRALYYDTWGEKLYIGRFINLSTYDVKAQKYEDFDLTQGGDPKTNNFTVIEPDGKNTLWFGSEAGVFQYDKTKKLQDKSSIRFLNNKGNGFRNEGTYVTLSGIIPDQRNLWFATEEYTTPDNPTFNIGGLYKFNRRAGWDKYDKRTGFPGNGISTILKTGDIIWLGLYVFERTTKTKLGQGLYIFNRTTGKISRANPDELQLTANLITKLHFDSVNLWIGTESGLWKVKLKNDFAVFPKKKK